MNTSDKTYVQNDTTHKQHRFFIRLGAIISSGTVFDESSSHLLTYPFTRSNNITQNDFSSRGMVASVGVQLTRKRKSGLHIIGVLKSGSDSTNAKKRLSYTQFGSALELYYGNKTAKFLLGTLLSYGVTDHPSGENDGINYVALEPYVGLNITMTDDFSLLSKVGYEWRDYEEVSYHDLTVSHASKLSAYHLTGSLLLQYNF